MVFCFDFTNLHKKNLVFWTFCQLCEVFPCPVTLLRGQKTGMFLAYKIKRRNNQTYEFFSEINIVLTASEFIDFVFICQPFCGR